MREDLLDDSEGLRIARTRSKVPCAWSRTNIEEGTHAIAIRIIVNGNSYLAWCSIGSVEDMQYVLDDFDEDEHEVRSELSPSGCVKYNRVKGEQIRCATCQEHIPKGTEAISFRQPRERHRRTSTVWNHIGCLDEFVNALDDVWEYTSDLIPSQL